MASLIDSYNRDLNYLRIAVTDRCNFRCQYCMPNEGIKFLKRSRLMSYEELLRLSRIVVDMGVNKIRLTGGEPFVRKDLIYFLKELSKICSNIHITSNGSHLIKHIPELEKIGLRSLNLSLDSLQRERFTEITRRDHLFETVTKARKALVKSSIDLKINMVVQKGVNEDEIPDFINLALNDDIEIRFIEEMPFNGSSLFNTGEKRSYFNYKDIVNTIESHFSKLKIQPSTSPSSGMEYKLDGFKGRIVVIPAYSRLLCGDCNRLRLTPVGGLRTCLYSNKEFNLKDLMRSGATNHEIKEAISQKIKMKAKDGNEAEAHTTTSDYKVSMAKIGG